MLKHLSVAERKKAEARIAAILRSSSATGLLAKLEAPAVAAKQGDEIGRCVSGHGAYPA